MKNLLSLLTLFLLSTLYAGCSDDSPGTTPTFPVFTAEGLTVEEADNDIIIEIPLTLSKSISQSAFVNYATSNETAYSGLDYKSTSGTLEFLPGETSKTLEITIIGDLIKEQQESFILTFNNGINMSLETKEIVITITDSDTQQNTDEIDDKGYTSPTSYTGYSLTWEDQFEGSALSSDWTYEIGTGSNGWGNNELQYYREENTTVRDGYLIIEAKKENYGGRSYTSSRIVTMDQQSFQYGRIDIRALLPQGQGIWPALWMLGHDFKTVGWPSCGEIDIMELVGGNGRDNEVHGTVHWSNNGSYANYGGSYELSSGIFANEFHVFSIEWNANEIRWYVDDVHYHTIDITPQGLDEFRDEFFFIFNVAVGGNWPGSPDASTVFPQRMVVDYVRVFQKN